MPATVRAVRAYLSASHTIEGTRDADPLIRAQLEPTWLAFRAVHRRRMRVRSGHAIRHPQGSE